MTSVRKRKTAAVAARNQYDAAGSGRRIAKWNPPASGPNRSIQGAEKIRNRARDSVRNDWAAGSTVQKWTTALVGVGITPRWDDAATNDEWKTFAKVCDADGVLDAYGLQALGTEAWLASGEVFLRRRPRDLSLPLPAPVQFQLIESDFVPRLDADTYQGLPVGNTIRQGIERNKYGRRIAYWMYREHPGDPVASVTNPNPSQLIRVPASDVRHIYKPARPGALRGVSDLARILVRLRASADFEDAVLDRQKLANLFVAFIKRTMPPDWADIDIDPLTGLPKFYNAAGSPMVGLEPGTQQELQPGEEMQFANPPEAGTTFSDYMRTTGLGTAAGGGLPYELMAGDIQNVSDRTLRVIINEFRRYAEQRQWHTVIPMLCQPMVDWWAEARALAGQIRVSQVEKVKACEWFPHGWDYIHPVQDVQGKVMAIEAGLTSKSDEISKRGDDPKKVFAQRAADQKTEDDLGIKPPTPAPAAVPGKPTPGKQGQGAEADDPTRLLLDSLLAANAQAQAPLLDLVRAMSAHAQAQPQHAVTHEQVAQMTAAAMATAMQPLLAQMAATNGALLEAIKAMAERGVVTNTPVNVNVEPTPVNLNVEPTPVNVTNEVNVPPAEVTANVVMPDRQRETEVTYDKDGNIAKSVSIEKTLQ